MKLFTKISLVVAAIALGLGILFVVMGYALGADASDLSTMGIHLSPHQQMAVSGVITNVLDEGLEDTLEDVVENVVEENIHFYRDTESNHSKSVIEHNSVSNEKNVKKYNNTPTGQSNLHGNSFTGINRLEIDIPNVQLTLVSTEGTDEITYHSNGAKNIAGVEGTCLKFEDETSVKNKIELEIHIPIGVLKEIEIEAANGSISADRILADHVSIDINNASVEIQELVVSGKARLEMNAGEIVVGYYEGKHLETECDAGSILIVCEGGSKDYNYELECGIGSIQIDKDSYSGIGNDLRIDNQGQKSIKAECGIGEITLEFPNG